MTALTQAIERNSSVADDWEHRLDLVVAMMREISAQTDPEEMVRTYGRRVQELVPRDGLVSLSRRDLSKPQYRITRSSRWMQSINPWKDKERLPVLKGGLLGDLIYSEEPHLIDELEISPDDPARDQLEGMRSLMAVPLYDKGQALNMVVMLKKEPGGFDRQGFPEMVWLSNLFGRATHNLVLNDELKTAYQAVDHELRIVEDLQRSLLPRELPKLATMELAAHYQTSKRAGGDYYDFFRLDDGHIGILIADVSGHGAPAAVLMAVLHGIAHTYNGTRAKPDRFLAYLNQQLCSRYTFDSSMFVTAFYGVYDVAERCLTFANAGHNAPRLKHCAGGPVSAIDGALGFPLGVAAEAEYESATARMKPGDQIILYTDGITEAVGADHELFGVERLDGALGRCGQDAGQITEQVLRAVDEFTGGQPATDDRTLLIARIT